METLTCSICNETKPIDRFFTVDNQPIQKCTSCLFPSYNYPPKKPKRAYKKRAPKPAPVIPEVIERAPKVRKVIEYQQISPKEGFVYLLSSSVGIHKIGMAKDVSKRMGDFNRTIPIETKCIHHVPTSDKRLAEKYLHDKFAKQRVKYEWFELTQEQVDWICSLTEIDSLINVRNRSET